MPEYHAHSANGEGRRHGLVEHLRAVAELAREFSSPFGGGETAHYAGLWHDLGKFDPEFQRYLSGGRPRGPDHKGAGTRLACQHLGPGGLLVQGHHGGLGAMQYLKGWAAGKGATGAATQALESARRLIPELEPHHRVDFPDFVKRDPVKAELWLRMVFSALVDADFLDTERHFSPERVAIRSSDPDMPQLWERFQTRHRESVRGASGPVNALRAEVYGACLAAAERPPGLFRLTVPHRWRENPVGPGFRVAPRLGARAEENSNGRPVHVHHAANSGGLPGISGAGHERGAIRGAGAPLDGRYERGRGI